MNYSTKRIDTNSELLLGRERISTGNLNQYRYNYQFAEHPDEQVNEHFCSNISRIQYKPSHMITNNKITHDHPKKEKKSLTVLRHSPQEEDEDPSIPKISSRGGVKAPFPVKLMDLLNIVDDHPFDYDGTSLRSIISWQPDGKCFRVHDKVLFERHVQHQYFEQTNYTSFRRQLNLWGFKRIAGPKTGPNFGAYYHPQFTRDDKYSCRLMRRPSAIKNSNKKQTKKSTTTAASVSRNNKKKSSCKYPRSQSERVVVSPRYHPCSPTAVDHHDMHKRFSVPSSTSNNYSSRRMSNSYEYTSSTRNSSHMLTPIEEACSYVQRWDEEMTVVADDDSSNPTTGIDSTRKFLHDLFDEKIMRTLLEDELEDKEDKEEEVFQLPDCEPIEEEEEDVGGGSMEISLSPSKEIAFLLQIL
ncbi:hypothetical protein CTEN210_16207 [Chaetoceros tenuissimus]|uniref:HSF-type DNA-binding domain-containing protein n=1 Tax=Chaetoceros tenuissimus TaxID=426638 RepID=A0AAD3HDY2_9STRA|nr:hypothetical protein CTEN210_16207 [Chaetoceros tenuissimus]